MTEAAPVLIDLSAFGFAEPQSVDALMHLVCRAKTKAKQNPKRATTALTDKEIIALLWFADTLLVDVEGQAPPPPKPAPAVISNT